MLAFRAENLDELPVVQEADLEKGYESYARVFFSAADYVLTSR